MSFFVRTAIWIVGVLAADKAALILHRSCYDINSIISMMNLYCARLDTGCNDVHSIIRSGLSSCNLKSVHNDTQFSVIICYIADMSQVCYTMSCLCQINSAERQ